MTMNASRRAFLQRASALSLAGTAAPWALNLAAMGEAAAATATDYKALVCVFLYGGNDYGNTVIPVDAASYAAYQGMRPTLAYAASDLVATTLAPSVALPGGRQYALAPELAPLLPLFTGGKMGVMLNVGTLVQPTTKAQYTAQSVPLPPKLFSHNDQQSVWQSQAPEGA
ncbi:MAG: Tat pathway signal protein, partial [Caldimonas sp.]